jgi:3-hydroxyacyl-CoA dehydrogenase/3a,7a,12a-trihydroxy-5b-cholest-24-enoyl-CoA hydratase
MATVDDVMAAIQAAVETQGEKLAKQINGIVVYEIDGRKWTVTLKNGVIKFAEGGVEKPDLTVVMGGPLLLELATGKANAQQAFMQGKLKIKGNMAMAMKLNTVMDAAKKAGIGTVQVPTKAAAPAAPAAPAAAPAPASTASSGAGAGAGAGLKSKPFFEAIAAAVESDGASLVQKVKGKIQFVITAGSPSGAVLAQFALDLKSGAGAFASGTGSAAAPDLTLTVSDEDFVGLATGKLNSQQAFMQGKIKIKGSMALAMKLGTVLAAARKGPAAKL